MKTWILVANSSVAKLFTTDNIRTGVLELKKELAHPNSRKKVSELMSDKPGHYKTDSQMRGAYVKNDPKEVEAEHFACDLAREVKIGCDSNEFKKIIIVTPAHFYGLLKKHWHLNGNIEESHISKDYTKYGLSELQDALNKHLFG